MHSRGSFWFSYLFVCVVVAVCYLFDFVVVVTYIHNYTPTAFLVLSVRIQSHAMHEVKRSVFCSISLSFSPFCPFRCSVPLSLCISIDILKSHTNLTATHQMPDTEHHHCCCCCRLCVCVSRAHRHRACVYVCVHGTQTTFTYSCSLRFRRGTAQHSTFVHSVSLRYDYSMYRTQHEQHQVTIKDHSTYSNCFIQCWYLVCRSERSSRIFYSTIFFEEKIHTDDEQTYQQTVKRAVLYGCFHFFLSSFFFVQSKWQWQISVCVQHIDKFNSQQLKLNTLSTNNDSKRRIHLVIGREWKSNDLLFKWITK